MSAFDRVVDRLEALGLRRDGARWECPAHEDRTPSLALKPNGRNVLLYCHGGCETAAVVGALGLRMSDLFDDESAKARSGPEPEPANNPDLEVLGPATSAQREALRAAGRVTRPEVLDALGVKLVRAWGAEWLGFPTWDRAGWKLWALDGEGAPRLDAGRLIRRNVGPVSILASPDIVDPTGAGRSERLWDVEGEGDLLAAVDRGMTHVVTGTGGATSVKGHESSRGHLLALEPTEVVVVRDLDDAGRKGAEVAARWWLAQGVPVRVLKLPDALGECGDLRDYLLGTERAAPLGDPADLDALADAMEQRQPEREAVRQEPERWRRAETTRLADVRPEQVTWLWPGRIPRGAVTILDGDPDLGKSTVTLAIAARVTTGRPMPDGTGGGEPADVVVVSYEDALGATIRPRLDAAGADASRVHSLAIDTEHGTDALSLPRDLAALEEAVARTAAALVILDPLMAALSGEVDSHRDQDVRRVLAPLACLAETHGVAIVAVRHLRKSGGASPLYAGGGSIGIVGAARSALLVAADPQDPTRRVLARSKCNLAAPVPSLGYRLVPAGSTVAVEWLGAVGHTAGALIEAAGHGAEERSERTEAEEWLLDALRDGPRPVKEVRREARAEGIADRTLRRAKSSLGVDSIKAGLREGWSWMLPPKGAKGATKGAGHESVAPFGHSGPLREESSTYETLSEPKAPKGATPASLAAFEPEEPMPLADAGLDELEREW